MSGNRMSSKEFRQLMADRGEIMPKTPVTKPQSKKRFNQQHSEKHKSAKIPDLLEYSKKWHDLGGIYIPNEVISKKNSKRPMPYLDPRGKPRCNLVLSAPYERYVNLTVEYYMDGKWVFFKTKNKHELTYPYYIGMYFIRKTKSLQWDFHNMVHGPLDIMEYHNWFPYDNARHVLTYPLGSECDPAHPGVVIFLMNPKIMAPIMDIPKVGVQW